LKAQRHVGLDGFAPGDHLRVGQGPQLLVLDDYDPAHQIANGFATSWRASVFRGVAIQKSPALANAAN
jgi:hypothetical protein